MAYNVAMTPGRFRGSVTVPPSKSLLHRALFCAAFAQGTSDIGPRHDCDDVLDTLRVLKALGATIVSHDKGYRVTGINTLKKTVALSIRASATTLRFLVPLLAATETVATIALGPSLVNRPLSTYEKLFGHGVKKQGGTLIVDASLPDGNIVLDALESSQVLSGLLLAFAVSQSTASIHVTSLPSAGYVALTEAMLLHAGVRVVRENDGYRIEPSSTLNPFTIMVEGDASHAALWLAGSVLGGPLTVKGVAENSLQADAIFSTLLSSLGVKIENKDGHLTAFPGRVRAFTYSVDQHPDLAFALALLALVADGPCVLTHTQRLMMKESNRVDAIVSSLQALGVSATHTTDTITIHPLRSLRGGVELDARSDHRLAMMLALCAPLLDGEIVITGADAIDKSYPDFFSHYRALGPEVRRRKGR